MRKPKNDDERVPRKDEPRANERIRVPRVLVIADDGQKLGEFLTADAIALARERGLDLIEVSPNARPPVCKISDFGRLKYDRKKKEAAARKRQSIVNLKEVKIENKMIGENHPCYTVAEIGGAFHNIEEAKRLIDSAVEIKVDAIKFQTLEAETITTKSNLFDLETTGRVSQYELFKEAEISKELQLSIVKYANDKGITIFSAPSHIDDLDIMKKMDLAVYKIGSDLSCHIPLLKEVSKIGKPIILSTGMCTLEEVKNSVNAILSEGNDQLVVLHCVSDYPTKPENVNLNAILTMKEEFNIPVGYSDHTVGNLSSIAAVSLGANMIERHFRDIQNPKGVDDTISLVKDEFQDLINNIRLIEKMKGTGTKIPTKLEQKNMRSNKVSIISLQDIKEGETITSKTIDVRRPGNGIQPIDFEKVLGKKSKVFIPKETPIQWKMIE